VSKLLDLLSCAHVILKKTLNVLSVICWLSFKNACVIGNIKMGAWDLNVSIKWGYRGITIPAMIADVSKNHRKNFLIDHGISGLFCRDMFQLLRASGLEDNSMIIRYLLGVKHGNLRAIY
jgi:hypothetical protein